MVELLVATASYVGSWLLSRNYILGFLCFLKLLDYYSANKVLKVCVTLVAILPLLNPIFNFYEASYIMSILFSLYIFFLNSIFFYKLRSQP